MVGQLPPVVVTPTGAEEFIVYVGGVPKTMTAAQIAHLAGSTIQYALQWAIWFNGTPIASELLALYVSPCDYQYDADFAGSRGAAPLTNPTADYVLNVDRQVNGAGAWENIGTITITSAGTYNFRTTGRVIITIATGDRLRVTGPATADTSITGFAATFKGQPRS